MSESTSETAEQAPSDAPTPVSSPHTPRVADSPTAWITARLEVDADGNATLVEARLTAAHPYGARDATAHTEVPDDARPALADALLAALQSGEQDVRERAEEAALAHRIRSREEGIDFHKAAEYVGPVVEVSDQIYSDPVLMALPKGEREAAANAHLVKP